MKKIFVGLGLMLSCLSATAQNWPATSLESKAGSRWWWLGSAVDEENLKWNMAQYAAHGIGTLEITPLYGVQGNDKNNIPFLSPKWMEMLGVTQSLGKQNGIQIDMNTGTGWPFGGPTTPIEEAACKAVWVDTVATDKVLKKGISIVAPEKEKAYAKLDKVMAYPKNVAKYNGGCVDITAFAKDGVLAWKAPKKGEWRVIALYVSRTRQKVKRAAPGGEGWVMDHFDKNAVKHYLARFTEAFAKSGAKYPHTFFNDSYEVYHADWTPTLLQEFAQRRGYKLEEHFPELLAREAKVISDYRETLSDMLLDNFTIQWTDWAHEHGALTRNQAHGSPANLIDLYAAVDIPEIEGFGLSDFNIKGLRTDPGFTRENFSDFSMLKYAPSAAHITGKKLVSSETFTWLTEHFRTSLSQMKPDLDLMFTAGVNRIFYHGTCYSPKNDRWPGWKFYASIDMSPTNSIWRDATYMNKYIERCQSFLQWGEADNDFLVYFPVRNSWQRPGKAMLMQFDIHSISDKTPEFKSFILQLDSMGYTSDYISDKYLLTTTYKNGKLQTAAGVVYKGLIVPKESILTDKLRRHLNDLKAQGAPVFFGLNDNELAGVARAEEMKTGKGRFNYIRRKNANGYHYFISNLHHDEADSYAFSLSVSFKDVMLFDPMTGARYKADITSDGKINLPLRSGQSVILETFNEPITAELAGLKKYKYLQDATKQIALNGKWTLSFTEEAPKVEKTYQLAKPQTWETLDGDSVKQTMGTGVYATTFTATKTQLKGTDTWNIDLGDVRESARVYINDSLVGCAWSAPFTLNFPSRLLKAGKNTLRIEVTNLSANRIAALDREGYKWRKFNEINVVDLHYKKTTYENWAPMKSGLNSEVKIFAAK